MITIVGKDQNEVKRITHKNCGTILEYYESDVRELYRGKDISGGADGTDGFTCPVCGQNVIVRSF